MICWVFFVAFASVVARTLSAAQKLETNTSMDDALTAAHGRIMRANKLAYIPLENQYPRGECDPQSARKPHEIYCDRFYQCAPNHMWGVGQCPQGTAYSTDKNDCLNVDQVSCDRRSLFAIDNQKTRVKVTSTVAPPVPSNLVGVDHQARFAEPSAPQRISAMIAGSCVHPTQFSECFSFMTCCMVHRIPPPCNMVRPCGMLGNALPCIDFPKDFIPMPPPFPGPEPEPFPMSIPEPGPRPHPPEPFPMPMPYPEPAPYPGPEPGPLPDPARLLPRPKSYRHQMPSPYYTYQRPSYQGNQHRIPDAVLLTAIIDSMHDSSPRPLRNYSPLREMKLEAPLNPPVATMSDGFRCPSRFGRYPDNRDCRRFWQCQEYGATLHYCPKEELFDRYKLCCQPPAYAKCL